MFDACTRTLEQCLSSISDCPISHASQLSNPFLGLPLEVGKCESCGTAEPGKCEGVQCINILNYVKTYSCS